MNPKEQLKSDVLEYLDKDQMWYDERVKICRNNRRRDWAEQNPKTADEIQRFYETSDKEDFIVNLCDFNCRETLHFPPVAWFPGVKSFMEFGCGLGTLSFHMAQLGAKVHICDLETEAFAFAKWRLKKHFGDSEHHWAIVDGVLPDLGKLRFDAIGCVDVIEHLVNPVEIIWRFYEALTPGGVLYITNVSAQHDDVHNWHLIAQPPMLRELMFKMGFKPGANYSLYVKRN